MTNHEDLIDETIALAEHNLCVQCKCPGCNHEHNRLAKNARLLVDKVRELEARVEEAYRNGLMACESPPSGCDCSGCAYAEESPHDL